MRPRSAPMQTWKTRNLGTATARSKAQRTGANTKLVNTQSGCKTSDHSHDVPLEPPSRPSSAGPKALCTESVSVDSAQVELAMPISKALTEERFSSSPAGPVGTAAPPLPKPERPARDAQKHRNARIARSKRQVALPTHRSTSALSSSSTSRRAHCRRPSRGSGGPSKGLMPPVCEPDTNGGGETFSGSWQTWPMAARKVWPESGSSSRRAAARVRGRSSTRSICKRPKISTWRWPRPQCRQRPSGTVTCSFVAPGSLVKT
mmetsp:Transcript_87496/g.283294  ORF Transcript_87496/g.283294 Transcript_87496/m.283294 type:complete len:261 (-) Transcript_87496:303-1085(-)